MLIVLVILQLLLILIVLDISITNSNTMKLKLQGNDHTEDPIECANIWKEFSKPFCKQH